MTYRYNVGAAFRAVAARQPHRPAIKSSFGDASYSELDDLSNNIAASLLDRGLRRRDVIGIVHEKETICYATMLAALKLGIAYVNLDQQNPPARLAHILKTSRPQVIVGKDIGPSVRIAATEFAIPLQEDVEGAPDAHRLAEVKDAGDLVIGSDPAYIMYTSGSTGVPKGAMMTHANVLNFGAWAESRFGITPDDVLTNVNPMYFDNSVFDFYGSMLNGAAMAPVARAALSNGAEVVRQVEAAGCTIWFSVPSMLIYLSTMKLIQRDRLKNVRTFVFGGEGYPKPELRKLFSAHGTRAKLVNVYGPTECTCICSAWDVSESDLEDDVGLVTLGYIAENFSMAVLDGEREVSAGEVGELCLLGPQVGLGYVNDPDRTAQAFVINGANDRWSERMYRTGDLVRLGPDGRKLDFVGRKDNQIKHMGYRIELEEIEAALNRLEGVVQSAVLQKSGRRGQKMLVAYVAADETQGEDRLRNDLATYLPPYMIPQRFDVRASLPKNANGKIDKIALAAEEI